MNRSGNPAQFVLSLLQIGRVGLVGTAVSNIWLMVFLSRAMAGDENRLPPLSWHLFWTALVALGLYVFGMTLNDLMDRRHDRTFAPDRPLPSGRISLPAACLQAMVALATALGSSLMLGTPSLALCLGCATLIVLYDGLAKHIPGVGLILLGLIRATHMLIAWPEPDFIWPVWFTFSHVVGISAAAYRLEGKRPALTGFHLWLLTGGWAFLTMTAIAWNNSRADGISADPWLWAGPVIAASVFLALAMRQTDAAPSERAAGGKLIKLGLLWLIVLDASWLASSRQWIGAGVIAALLPLSLAAMSAIRWLHQMSQEEPGYLRESSLPVPPQDASEP